MNGDGRLPALEQHEYGEREGEGLSVSGNGAAVVSQPAVAPPPVVNKEGMGTGGWAVEKVKFTVSVRGHQWSSARHVDETLQEFATVIQRNARRLEFIEEGDSIQRLQLAYGDGSEREDLDVDATLSDVIICMRDKKLVAIVNSTKSTSLNPPPSANGARSDTASLSPASPIAIALSGAHHKKPKSKSDTDRIDYNSPFDATTSTITTDITTGPKFVSLPYKFPAAKATPKAPASIEPSRTLKIANHLQTDHASTSPPFQVNCDRRCSFHSDYMNSSSLPPLRPSRSNGKVVRSDFEQGSQTYGHSQGGSLGEDCPAATPNPAVFAGMLVRSSPNSDRVSMQQPQEEFVCQGNVGGTGAAVAGQCRSRSNVALPASKRGFQNFATALLSRLPMLTNLNTVQCSHGVSTNITLLAQFVVSQLQAFVAVENCRGPPHYSMETTHLSSCRRYKPGIILSAKDPMNVSSAGGVTHIPSLNCRNGQSTVLENKTCPDNVMASPKKDSNVKSGSGSHETNESSSSANVNATVPLPTGDVVNSAPSNERNELVFLINRRSKRGVGTHYLKMSDLSVYFHLSVVDAAKKLGVSQTTLKKACRNFGLKRWPCRKVRSLESTIHGLEHTIAVGQGAGLKELTEAYMRNEVQKLQQEMDQLVHGTPAQHSPAVRSADLYKRLYSRGWRSKYHRSGLHDVDLNAGYHEVRSSGLDPQSAKKAIEVTRVADPFARKIMNGGPAIQQQMQTLAKDEPVSYQHTVFHGKQVSDVVGKNVDIEGLLRELSKENSQALKVATQTIPENELMDNDAGFNCTYDTNGEKGFLNREVTVEEKEITFPERSPKRSKREGRIFAEAAARQGLRSSTCAV